MASKPEIATVVLQNLKSCPPALLAKYPGCGDAWTRAAEKAETGAKDATSRCMRNGCICCVLTAGFGVFCVFFSFRDKLDKVYVRSFAEEGFEVTWYSGGNGDGGGSPSSVTVYAYTPGGAPGGAEMAR